MTITLMNSSIWNMSSCVQIVVVGLFCAYCWLSFDLNFSTVLLYFLGFSLTLGSILVIYFWLLLTEGFGMIGFSSTYFYFGSGCTIVYFRMSVRLPLRFGLSFSALIFYGVRRIICLGSLSFEVDFVYFPFEEDFEVIILGVSLLLSSAGC